MPQNTEYFHGIKHFHVAYTVCGNGSCNKLVPAVGCTGVSFATIIAINSKSVG